MLIVPGLDVVIVAVPLNLLVTLSVELSVCMFVNESDGVVLGGFMMSVILN